MIASRISSTPTPVFAEARTVCVVSSPMMVSICSLMPSGSADGQIDLVQNRNQLEIVLDREISVRERLRLDALRSIDNQQMRLRTLTSDRETS